MIREPSVDCYLVIQSYYPRLDCGFRNPRLVMNKSNLQRLNNPIDSDGWRCKPWQLWEDLVQVTCVMGLNQCPSLSTKKEQKQSVCKNLTEIVDVFDIVVELQIVPILITRNEFVMKLPQMQVGFECYDGIRIPYMEKACWCVYGGIDVGDVGA